MNIEIKRTNDKNDLVECAKLFTKNDPWKSLNETYEYNLEKVSSKDTEVYVALDDKKVVGCLVLEMHSTLKAFVRGLVVDENYRSQKVGAKLLAHAEKRAFEETENVFMFCGSDRGRNFYKKNGYIEIGSIDNLNVTGINETIFRKTIGPSKERKK